MTPPRPSFKNFGYTSQPLSSFSLTVLFIFLENYKSCNGRYKIYNFLCSHIYDIFYDSVLRVKFFKFLILHNLNDLESGKIWGDHKKNPASYILRAGFRLFNAFFFLVHPRCIPPYDEEQKEQDAGPHKKSKGES